MRRLIVERYDLYNDEYDDTLDDGETFLGKHDVESGSDDDGGDGLGDGQDGAASKSRARWRQGGARRSLEPQHQQPHQHQSQRRRQQQSQQQQQQQQSQQSQQRKQQRKHSGREGGGRHGGERVQGRMTEDAREFVPKRVSIERPQRPPAAGGESPGTPPRGGRAVRGGRAHGTGARAGGGRREPQGGL